MADTSPHRCRVKLLGRSCEHELCYPIHRARGVPQELRCIPDQPAGFGRGGGGCCVLPPDIEERVDRELRDNLQECRRLGYVLIRAA